MVYEPETPFQVHFVLKVIGAFLVGEGFWGPLCRSCNKGAPKIVLVIIHLVAEFISPKKGYTFGFIVCSIIPDRVKFTLSGIILQTIKPKVYPL